MNQEYKTKKEDVINKFQNQLLTVNPSIDPQFYKIVEMLSNDVDPYLIIEQLIEQKADLMARYKDLINHLPKEIYLQTESYYDFQFRKS